ncbi:MAG: response regulator, partial [Phormidium sp.]
MQCEPKVNVLLVDDHPENLIALEAVLDGLGQNLVKAGSGEEALRCLLNQDFAVILLDVQMPGMDGFETATLIRQRERSRNTPIIFLTAFSTNENLMFKGYSLGAVDYLLKPIDPVILNSKVSVFVDLFKKNLEVQHQAAQLAAMNAELKQSEERFRTLSACSPVGIFLTDTSGKCTYSNPRFQSICGFITAENWQEEFAKLTLPEDRHTLLLEWPNYIRQGQPNSGEFRIYQSDKSLRWVHIRTAPMLSDNGTLLGHVGTIEDITERKQAEAVREQFIREHAARQQAEEANRMKDEFLAILSHELRTPLNSILGWSRLLVTKNFDEITRIKALETIERNARSQARLVNDILDVSQIIQGNLRLSIQPVNLQNLIEVTVETARLQAEEKSIEIKTDLHPTGLQVSGDPERLRQVVANLLSNAIKFNP